MSVAGGIALLTIGAIITFAVSGSLRGIELHTVGAVLMVAGAALLVLRLVMPPRRHPKEWVARSRRDAMEEAADARREVLDDHEA
ncbi:DUF6458 family protein [Actinomadura sediminis]|uniref:DUF6458 family protein n=1 Tax=Actinomadura sediminis TaxID=1038904 RepID=A0ABW3EHT1_9ACTN